ncbi:transposase family protein [Micromonospora matsumotoense]|uniref:transposase family protein n=1 Tax=Micromonospora matsumotoense TaxID=121616 RepID=UPI003D8CD103
MAAWFGVHRSTISRSIAEIRPLLAERGCVVHDCQAPGLTESFHQTGMEQCGSLGGRGPGLGPPSG